jgi:hypothetical protein
MVNARSGLVVLGCVCVGFVFSAGPELVARAAEPDRWLGSIATGVSPNATGGGDARRRIVELEQRVKELEAERRSAASSAPPPRESSRELAAAIARSDELAARNRALSLQNQELAAARAFERPVSTVACEPPQSADAKAQLRYWAERLRDGDSGIQVRLSAEQNAALNVLLRRERALDPHNPWRATDG